MAGQAVKTLVRPLQRVICLNVVIKLPQRPAIRVMTAFATQPEAPLMHIIRLVTNVAVTCRRLECSIQMTFFAWHNCMQTD